MLGVGVGHEGLLLEEEILVSAKEMGEGSPWFRLGGVGFSFEWVRRKVRMFLRARESWLVFHVGDLLSSMFTQEKRQHTGDIGQEGGSKSLYPTAEQGESGPQRPMNHAFQSGKVPLSAERMRERRRLLPTKEAHYSK